jgi:multisubunit Na+/H+ antiporter MnhB subunit
VNYSGAPEGGLQVYSSLISVVLHTNTLGCEESRQEIKKEKIKMKILLIVGLLLVVLGVLSLVVPIPQTHSEGIKVGDAKLGVQTTHDEKVAPVISIVLIAGGIALSIAGARSK